MKIILIEDNYDGTCNDCGRGDPRVIVLDELASLLNHLSESDKTRLDCLGWKNIKKLKDATEKAVLEKEFYTIPKIVGSGYIYGARLVDISNLTTTDINSLVNGSILVQKVDTKSVLPESQHAKIEKAVKAKQAQEKARKQAAATKRKNKLARDLEKAKKLLEEHHEI